MRSPAFDPPLASADVDELAAWTRKVSDVLKAAAHEGRFLILSLLADGEKSVSDLEEITNLPQSVVSQHLARLRYGQLVKARRDGRLIYYSIAHSEIPALISVLHHLAAPEDRTRYACSAPVSLSAPQP
ncbi:MAG: metalloregulator ArsR/SmtB family transcription factor [Pseudaminobacter sp.]